jgi:hypothetical protein
VGIVEEARVIPLGHPTPALVIRIPLEAPPRVTADCFSEGEYRRLVDWLHAREDLHAFAVLALELAEAA